MAYEIVETGDSLKLLDTGGPSRETIPLLHELLEQLPFSITLHGVGRDFPVLYRNRRDRERLAALPERGRARDPRLREVAERVVVTRRLDHLEMNVQNQDGTRLTWEWIVSPLLDRAGDVIGLVSVVEDISRPAEARQRIESAVDRGMRLLLEVAQLAEQRVEIDDFLAGVAERLAEMVGADRVAFNEYDAARKVLVGRVGEHAPQGVDPAYPTTIPCDPDAADLLSQVMFASRVFRGTVDMRSFEFRPYAGEAALARQEGSQVAFAPWRAGDERLGVVVAQRAPGREAFTNEEATVLMAGGHTAGLVCRRKRAELRLAERARELESLERAKSSFLRLASHELRAPLTLLNGYTSLLDDPDLPYERYGEIVPILRQAVTRMNLLVTQLMDATRLEDSRLQLQREKADLRDVVRSAAENVLPIWRMDRGADFSVQVPPTAVPMVVDVLRVEMIVQNLLDNAFKYSSAGDRVSCELEAGEDGARVVVRDEGIGISEEEMADLFTRFGRVVNARNSHIGGTGLGLYISREIARMHGGEIVAASVEGRGSRFELVLPPQPDERWRDKPGETNERTGTT